MEISDRVGIGTTIVLTSACIYSLCGISGLYGSRGIKDEYSFTYNGKPAIVQYDDERFWPDDLWILIDGKDKIKNGTITSDDNKVIEVDGREFKIRDSESHLEKKSI